MAFTTPENDEGHVLSEINMIPLIDVMLVLLIVFIITVPVIQHSVKIELPQAHSLKDRSPPPETVKISIDASGQYHWGEQAVTDDDFHTALAQAAQQDPRPEVHIRGDKNVRYERVAQAMAAAQKAGLSKIGFITEP